MLPFVAVAGCALCVLVVNCGGWLSVVCCVLLAVCCFVGACKVNVLLSVVCRCLLRVDVWCRCRRLLTIVSCVVLFVCCRLLPLFVVVCSWCSS